MKHNDDVELKKLYVGAKPPPDLVILKIMRVFQASRKPLYLGTISLEIGYSLSQTQAILDGMVDAGAVRLLSDVERTKFDLRHDGVVYVWARGSSGA